MAIVDELEALFADLPREERLSAIREALAEGIRSGVIIAIAERGDIRYKHVEHCSESELARRLAEPDLN